MFNFYKKAFAIFVGLAVLTLVAGYVCLDKVFLRSELIPNKNSAFSWRTQADSDVGLGGRSSIVINDDSFSLNYNFSLSREAVHTYATVSLIFLDADGQYQPIDLSSFNALTFSVKCTPGNVLWFAVHTVDKQITRLDDPLTYRIPSTFFSCHEQWSQIDVDLTRLEIPQWWFDKFQIDLSKKAYQLDQVPRIAFGSSHQSPFDVNSNVQIGELTLHGRDWRYLYGFCAVILALWGGFAFWLFRQHTESLIRDIKEKLQKDRPLVAYQQLSMEPQRDRDESAILRFMATEYANAELNLELAVIKLGVSRTKINDVLKEELGYTFSTYLNKLRLTEAARLLSEKGEANVAEIAYTVGYKNVSYFNKLFKDEYGCTPKVFKKIHSE